MTDLPPGWAIAPLRDLVDVLDSKRVPVSARERSTRTGNVPYYGATGRVGWIDEALFDEDLVLLGEDGVKFLDRDKPKAYLVSGKAWVNNHAHALRVKAELLDRDYLTYFLNQFNFRGFANGTTRLKLTRSAMDRIPVPLVPVNEQRRIAASIDEHLTTLGSGTTSLMAAHSRAKRLESQVAEAALRSLGKVNYRPMGEILREPLRNGFSGRATYAENGIRTLTLSAVTQNEFSDRYTKIANVGRRNTESLWLADGDVFIQRSNTPDLVGTSSVYRGADRWAIYPDLLIRVRPLPTIIPEFLHAVLSSARVRQELRNSAKGLAGSMPKIDHDTVSRIRIPMVTVAEQTRVINEVAFVRSYASRLSSAIDVASERSTQLRRSLLTEAFAGRLVAQDPEDEPASVLLDRIRAERDEAGPQRRRRAAPSQ